MGSRNSKGFTLIEICVVIAIVAILSALSYPIWIQSKKSSIEVKTKSDLHQIWLALELYRQDNGVDMAVSGLSSEMGLPNQDQFYLNVLKKSSLNWWRAAGKKGYGPIYYPIDKSDDVTSDSSGYFQIRMSSWLKHVEKNGPKSILVGDFNHTTGCSEFPDTTCVFKAYGVSLEGGLLSRSGNGFIQSPDWWEGKL